MDRTLCVHRVAGSRGRFSIPEKFLSGVIRLVGNCCREVVVVCFLSPLFLPILVETANFTLIKLAFPSKLYTCGEIWKNSKVAMIKFLLFPGCPATPSSGPFSFTSDSDFSLIC